MAFRTVIKSGFFFSIQQDRLLVCALDTVKDKRIAAITTRIRVTDEKVETGTITPPEAVI